MIPPAGPPAALDLRPARVVELVRKHAGARLWRVELQESAGLAWSLDSLLPDLGPGDEVLLNCTAERLQLGTGGAHFILVRLGAGQPVLGEGRAAGHQLKLRYTPLQHRVLCVEDEESPHREVMEQATSLDGVPVLLAELHSSAAMAALAARLWEPSLRIVLVVGDTAALPLGISSLMERLQATGSVQGSVTYGSAFGGTLEALNPYTALLAARHLLNAGLIIATQGPGGAGTGLQYGWAALSLIEVLHAAAALQGLPSLAPRLSQSDVRARHAGVSHHTALMLKLLQVPAAVPYPADLAPEILDQLRAAAAGGIHPHRLVCAPGAFDPGDFEGWSDLLQTMGRNMKMDTLPFAAAAAAGRCAGAAATGVTERHER